MPIPWLKILDGALERWRGIAILILIALVWLKSEKIEDLEREAEGWDTAVVTLDEALKNNEAELLKCHETNQLNRSEAAFYSRLVDAAAVRAAEREAWFEAQMGEVYVEAEAMRGRDTGCRSLHSTDFPQWFTDWVRSEPANSGNGIPDNR